MLGKTTEASWPAAGPAYRDTGLTSLVYPNKLPSLTQHGESRYVAFSAQAFYVSIYLARLLTLSVLSSSIWLHCSLFLTTTAWIYSQTLKYSSGVLLRANVLGAPRWALEIQKMSISTLSFSLLFYECCKGKYINFAFLAGDFSHGLFKQCICYDSMKPTCLNLYSTLFRLTSSQ